MAGLLDNLPSRGKLLASSSGSILGRPPVAYICDHDTEPPESQTVKSDETNLLIRCLEGNKQKEVEAKKKQKTEKTAELKKRPPDSAGEGSAAKRQNTGTGSSKAKFTPQQLRGKANRELSDILKQQGLPVSGKKDDLVARILQAQG